MTNTKTANGDGAAYRSQVQVGIEEVEVTNGFKFLMKKRGPFSSVFNAARLPQVTASGAVEAWTEQGLITPGEIGDEQTVSHVNFAMNVVDQVIELSIRPKIVLGEAENDSQVSVKDISEDDLAILFTWAAGGKAGEMLARFSQGPGTDSLARAGRRKVRKKAK